MKKLIAVLFAAALLAGCAATNYKLARGNANDVKNGMTVAEAIAIIGIPPTDKDDDHIEWRRGNAQAYDGTKNGSIRYTLRQEKIADIPNGGIFSDSAAKTARAIRDERQAKEQAEWLAAVNAREKDEDAKKAKRAADIAAQVEADERKLTEQFAKELEAQRQSSYTCEDKISCAKAFALAQIFVSTNSDQKIQVATDTIVETYNPTETGKLGMKIVKMPSRGTSEIISITPSCKEEKYSALLCSMRRTLAYSAFRPFIQASLSR